MSRERFIRASAQRKCVSGSELRQFSTKLISGEVSEWFMVPFSKSGVQRCTGSSNLPLSATSTLKAGAFFSLRGSSAKRTGPHWRQRRRMW